MFTGFRFRREINVLPWLKFNISKTGISASIGPEAAHVTVGRDGTYVYADVPGKGTYFRRKLKPMLDDIKEDDDSKQNGEDADERAEEAANTPLFDRSLLDKFIATPEENAFTGAMNGLHDEDLDYAYRKAREGAFSADNAFLAGFLAIKHEHWNDAIDYFKSALENSDQLGTLFAKYELNFHTYLPISENFIVEIEPSRRDCLLAMAVGYEQLVLRDLAIKCLQEIREHHDPEDLIVRLLLAELLDEVYPDHPRVQHEIVVLAERIENDTPLHAALMFYRARALRRLNVIHAARDTLTKALKKKKGYPVDLLLALRYERALLYQQEGQEKRARQEFEKIYAVAPQMADVAERLGLAPKIDQPVVTGPLRDHLPSDVIIEDEPTPSDVGYEIESADNA